MSQNLSVHLCDNITPNELVKLKQQGKSIYRTAHIGNQYLSNLLLGTLGLPLYLYDKTIFTKDRNYHPAFKFTDGKKEKLCETKEILVPFGSFSEDIASQHSVKNPARLHYQSLKSLFGKNVFTESELFLRHEDKVRIVLEIVARALCDKIDRYVFPCGCVAPLQYGIGSTRIAACRHEHRQLQSSNLATEAIQLLHSLRQRVCDSAVSSSENGGAVPALALTQVICLLIGWWESGESDVYELSGPDMVNYALCPDFTRQLSQIFSCLHRDAPSDLPLPQELRMQLVPTADFRFGYVLGDKESALMLWAGEKLIELQKRKRSALKSEVGIDQRWAVAHDFDSIWNLLFDIIKQDGKTWNIFYDIRAETFFTHYDLLPDKTLVIPEVYAEMTFRDMRNHLKRLSDILSRSHG